MENIYNKIREMKKKALDDGIPIMVDDGIDFMINFIDTHDIRSILEIGTGTGYSSIMMALSQPNLKITTIEKNKERYFEALKNVKKFKLEDRITLIYKDALTVRLIDKFELIFIDAAKGKNKDFFTRFEKNLNTSGYVITDNMAFHGYVSQEEKKIESKNIRSLVRKIKEYIYFLENNIRYKTKIYDVGDGIAVSEKRL